MLWTNAQLDKTEAIAQFEKLVQALASAGLESEVRPGEDHSLLVFIKASSQDHLYGEVYRSRYEFFCVFTSE
jgi:anoctamin-10